MSGRTVVVDYGIGNVFSVCNALRRLGEDPHLTGDLLAIGQADRLILPGVGAFARCMDGLRERGLVDALRDYVGTGRPFLGICVGMQMLMDRSLEFGESTGLGFISGTVERIASQGSGGEHLRVPHIGWAPLQPTGGTRERWLETPLARGDLTHNAVYFVHSYHCVPADLSDRLAYVDYGGTEITAAVRRANIFGVQFHPERSGSVGQKVLQSFLEL
jgi:glutamine amidotransferase